MTFVGGIVRVLCTFMILSSSFTLLDFLALSMSSSMLLDSLAFSSTMLVVGAMGARQLQSVVKSMVQERRAF